MLVRTSLKALGCGIALLLGFLASQPAKADHYGVTVYRYDRHGGYGITYRPNRGMSSYYRNWGWYEPGYYYNDPGYNGYSNAYYPVYRGRSYHRHHHDRYDHYDRHNRRDRRHRHRH